MEIAKPYERRDQELSVIGNDPTGGMTRLLYTGVWKAGQEYVKAEMETFGMKTHYDAVGNLFGRIEGKELPEETFMYRYRSE